MISDCDFRVGQLKMLVSTSSRVQRRAGRPWRSAPWWPEGGSGAVTTHPRSHRARCRTRPRGRRGSAGEFPRPRTRGTRWRVPCSILGDGNAGRSGTNDGGDVGASGDGATPSAMPRARWRSSCRTWVYSGPRRARGGVGSGRRSGRPERRRRGCRGCRKCRREPDLAGSAAIASARRGAGAPSRAAETAIEPVGVSQRGAARRRSCSRR